MLHISMGDVPQGRVLSHFFFTVTVNDQPCNLVSNSVVYADDTILLVSNKNEKVLQVLKSLFKLLS